MNCSLRSRLGLTAGVVLASTMLFLPTAAQAAPSVAVQAVEGESPVSHLVLHPGADETQVGFNWFTSSEQAEQIQIAPVAAQTDENFPVEAAATFDAEMIPDNDQGLTTAKAAAAGLEANTEYVYRVGSEAGGWSQVYTYSTESFDGEFNFNFYGDAQLGSGASSELGEGTGLEEDAQGWYDTLDASMAEYPDASFLFHGGDQIDGYDDEGPLEEYLGDRDPQYDAFLAEGADVLREVPLATLSGNHDHGGWTYDEYWNMPNAGEGEDSRSYWYAHNNALVIGLDINTIELTDYIQLAQLETEAEQAEFLESLRPQIEAGIERASEFTEAVIAAQGADADWIIVGFHQSPFSQANHYYDPDIEVMREGFTQTLSDAGVDLVLGGHDHIYTRTHLMEGSTPVVPETAPAAGDELVQEDGQTLYITGSSSSGSKFYDFMDATGEDDPELVDYELTHPSTAMWSQDYTADFSNVQITPTTLSVTTHNSHDGSIVDDVTLTKADAAGPGETPAETPAETPTETSTETPTETSSETPGAAVDQIADDQVAVGADEADAGDELAQTGASTLSWVAAAFAALIAGGAMLVRARRKV